MDFSELDKRDRDQAIPEEGSLRSFLDGMETGDDTNVIGHAYAVIDGKHETLVKLPAEKICKTYGEKVECVGDIEMWGEEDERTGVKMTVHVFVAIELDEDDTGNTHQHEIKIRKEAGSWIGVVLDSWQGPENGIEFVSGPDWDSYISSEVIDGVLYGERNCDFKLILDKDF